MCVINRDRGGVYLHILACFIDLFDYLFIYLYNIYIYIIYIYYILYIYIYLCACLYFSVKLDLFICFLVIR